ncbi:DUF6894 family protein [Rhizobium laguerreae]|uniref:DUF6894 family protein n=2 Tax=Rhizobium laguerreae TaxID=1076926 RepID=UPI0021B133AE|nr:hypothetical protein [Rhizobium laguerreae]
MCEREVAVPRPPAFLTKDRPPLASRGASEDAASAYGGMLSLTSKVPMPRYYFNIIAGDGIREDLEGTELPSLEDARLEAIEDARALMSDAILLGQDISSRRLEICNEAGDVLLTVLFKNAIKPVA